jgi:hypothetical protein
MGYKLSCITIWKLLLDAEERKVYASYNGPCTWPANNFFRRGSSPPADFEELRRIFKSRLYIEEEHIHASYTDGQQSQDRTK